MLDQIVGYMFEAGLEIAVNNLPHVLRQTVAKVVAKKGTDLYYTIRGQKTDREILVELNGKINSLGTSSEAMEAIAVIKQYTESFNESFKQNSQIYEEISGLNERLRSDALENQLKLQLVDVLNSILPHYGVKFDLIEGLVRKSTLELHIRFDDVEEILNRFGGDLGDIKNGVNEANEKLNDLGDDVNGVKKDTEAMRTFFDAILSGRKVEIELYKKVARAIVDLADREKDTPYSKLNDEQKRALFEYYDVNRNIMRDEQFDFLIHRGRFMKADYFSRENLFYNGQNPISQDLVHGPILILRNPEERQEFTIFLNILKSRIFNRLCDSGISERYHIMFVRRLDKLIECEHDQRRLDKLIECEHDQENELAKINQEKIMNELAELGFPDSFYEGKF